MKTLHFEDCGQDFLRWYLNEHGVVVDCQPFQASIWCGAKVLNDPKVGDQVTYIPKYLNQTRTIKYPVVEITYTCDICKQERFSERGWKAHQGTKACKRRASELKKAGGAA